MDIDGIFIIDNEQYNELKKAIENFKDKSLNLIKDNIDLCLKEILSRKNERWILNYQPELQLIIDNPSPETWSDNEWKIVYDYKFDKITIYIGSNESIAFDDLQEFLDKISITEISEELAIKLKEHEINDIGFAHKYYNYVFQLVRSLENVDFFDF